MATTSATNMDAATCTRHVFAPRGLPAPHFVREQRRWMVGGEAGFNGLTGVGLLASANLTSYFSLDGAAGASKTLARLGIRGRYNFLAGPITPFLGLGVLYNLAPDTDTVSTIEGRAVTWHTHSAAFVQTVGGVAYNARHGFTLLASLGWVQLFNGKSNVTVRTPGTTETEKRSLRATEGSGPVASVAVGYSF